MAVAWVQTVTTWAGITPKASASFTPAAGDQIPVFAIIGPNGVTGSVTGTGTYSALAAVLSDALNDNSLQLFANTNASASAQTATVNSSLAGSEVYGWAFEYSGAASVTASNSGVLQNNPGVGTGAILGASVVVPTGGILLAICADTSGGASAISSPAGTNRGTGTIAGVRFCITEYAGSGAAVQPSFTSASGAVDEFWVGQILLSPPASFPPVPESPVTKAQINALLVN